MPVTSKIRYIFILLTTFSRASHVASTEPTNPLEISDNDEDYLEMNEAAIAAAADERMAEDKGEDELADVENAVGPAGAE